MEFADRDSAKAWIIRNQLGRRNLKEWDRFDLTKSLEEIEKRKAKERMSDGAKGAPILADAKGETRDKMASLIGVSHGTYDKMKAIDESNDERLKQQVRNGDISIHKGWQIATGKEIKTKSPAKAKQESRNASTEPKKSTKSSRKAKQFPLRRFRWTRRTVR